AYPLRRYELRARCSWRPEAAGTAGKSCANSLAPFRDRDSSTPGPLADGQSYGKPDDRQDRLFQDTQSAADRLSDARGTAGERASDRQALAGNGPVQTAAR